MELKVPKLVLEVPGNRGRGNGGVRGPSFAVMGAKKGVKGTGHWVWGTGCVVTVTKDVIRVPGTGHGSWGRSLEFLGMELKVP